MTHRFARGVVGATPQGARCVELRLKPQLGVAARSELASPTSSCLPTGRGRRCRSWRSCRLPRRVAGSFRPFRQSRWPRARSLAWRRLRTHFKMCFVGGWWQQSGRFLGGMLVPTRQEGAGTVTLDPSLAGIDMVRMLSDEDFPTTGIRVAQDGSIAAR